MRLVSCLTVLYLVSAVLADERPKFGVLEKSDSICPGYTLVSPLSAHRSFLLDNDGRVVHFWQADRKPGQASYLLPDGSLLRAGKVKQFFQFPSQAGSGGRLQKYDWDGNLIWDYVSSSPYRMTHHDIQPLPNGNILCIAWESYLREVAEQAGRNPEQLVGDVLWFEAIFELKPKGLNDAEIVWKWSTRDHVVQDWDETKDHYGDPSEHPELIDINFMLRPSADWLHMNSIDYNPELDQIMVGSRSLSEIWIIDHGTTTEEAKGHVGGRRGRGGDLLYRWGNPQTYRRGKEENRRLYSQHDAHWVPDGLPGAGNILVFNNGTTNSARKFSTVDEIKPPLKADGTYELTHGTTYGPEEPVWSFEDGTTLFSPRISGAQRLPNGNTLICSGTQYIFQEVTKQGTSVWKYRNPPRFFPPPAFEKPLSKPTLSSLPEAELEALKIPGGIPLQDGGTMFNVRKYPIEYSGFRGRTLQPVTVPIREEDPEQD